MKTITQRAIESIERRARHALVEQEISNILTDADKLQKIADKLGISLDLLQSLVNGGQQVDDLDE